MIKFPWLAYNPRQSNVLKGDTFARKQIEYGQEFKQKDKIQGSPEMQRLLQQLRLEADRV